LERLRLRWGRTRRGDSRFGNRQGPSVLLELIGMISLLTRVRRVRSSLWFWSGLGVLGERSLSSGELVHDILNGLLGVVPGLVGSGSRRDIRDWLFLDLGLSGRRARGTSQNIEWGREFEQRFASRRFHVLLLPLGASRLRNRFRGLLGGLVHLREIVLIHLRPRGLLLRLRRDERRRGRNRGRCGLRKRRGRVREVGGGSSAEVKKVRNGLETRHQLIQQNFALVFRGVWALDDVCPLRVSRSRRSRDLSRCLMDRLRLLRLLWLHDGHQGRSSVRRGVVRRHGAQKRKQDICRVIRWWGSGGRRIRTAAWDGVERTRGRGSGV
jgi:hypothetical protein